MTDIQVTYINKYGRYKSTSDTNKSIVAKYTKNTKSHVWEMNNTCYHVYGFIKGKVGSENKYELPPPLDNELFYNDILVVKTELSEKELNLKKVNITGLIKKEEWDAVYEGLFGGFHDIGSEDSEMSEEDSEINDYELTKEGYAKDGFVVD